MSPDQPNQPDQPDQLDQSTQPTTYLNDIILEAHEISPRWQAWLAQAAPAQTVVIEQLGDGRVVLRPMPTIDPVLLAHVRVTIARYHEALTNLT